MMQGEKSSQEEADFKAPFVLALDVGTSSTRAMLFDATGISVREVASQLKYNLTTSEQGEVSVDAQVLLHAVSQTIDELLEAAGPMAQQIGAVATDTFWHSLLAVDEAGKPLTPVITWEDTRPHDAARELRKELDEHAVHERTGARFHASYWPAKLRWLASEQPEVFKSAAQWISFGEYVHRSYLGRSVCSLSMAAATGMLTTSSLKWDSELIQVLGVRPEQLAPLGDARDSIKGLTSEYTARWPALRDVPWFPAIGDGAAACIGSGCASRENWALTIGTSSAIRVVVPTGQIELPGGLWLYLIDAKRAVLGGALSEGGNLMAWMAHNLQVPSLKEVEPAVAALEPDGHGLTILPFISGERSPGWHADAELTITGISTHTAPEAILRASMEALAYQLAVVYEQMCDTLQAENSGHRMICSGGALLNSSILQSIIADTFETALYPSQAQEASARGCALLALEALGIIADVALVAPVLETPVQPDAGRGAIYKKAAKRQYKLYQMIFDEQTGE